eukprot:4310759-Prymnesium_polylepis.1
MSSSLQRRLESSASSTPPMKTTEEAMADLATAVAHHPGAVIVAREARYLQAQLTDPVTGVVDVEFLFSADKPIVGYRSQPQPGAGRDDQRGRSRCIRELHEALAKNNAGWKIIGGCKGSGCERPAAVRSSSGDGYFSPASRV